MVMKRWIPLLFSVWIGLAGSARAAKSDFEFFIGAYDPGSELSGTFFKTAGLIGFRSGRSITPFAGTEFSYTLLRNLVDPGKNFTGRAHAFNGNFLLQVPAGQFIPFGTVGFGTIVGSSNEQIKFRVAPTWNTGGGIKITRIFGPAGLRFDVRYYRSQTGTELPLVSREVDFTFAEITGGLLFSW